MGFQSRRTVSLGYNNGKVTNGPVGVAEPATVELEENGGLGYVGCSLTDAYCGVRHRRPCKHKHLHEVTYVSEQPLCLPS